MTTKWTLRLSYYIYKELHIDCTNVTSLVPMNILLNGNCKNLDSYWCKWNKMYLSMVHAPLFKIISTSRKEAAKFTENWQGHRHVHWRLGNQIMATNSNKEMAESLCSVCEVEETANVSADSLVFRQLVLWAVIVLLAATCVSKGHSFNWRVFGNEETFILDYNLHHKIRCQTCPLETILFLGHYNVHRIVKASGLQWNSMII